MDGKPIADSVQSKSETPLEVGKEIEKRDFPGKNAFFRLYRLQINAKSA